MQLYPSAGLKSGTSNRGSRRIAEPDIRHFKLGRRRRRQCRGHARRIIGGLPVHALDDDDRRRECDRIQLQPELFFDSLEERMVSPPKLITFIFAFAVAFAAAGGF